MKQDLPLQQSPAFKDLVTVKDEKTNWSDDMTSVIAESTRNHFIDRYNRALAIKAMAPALGQPQSRYIDIGCAAGYLLADAVQAFPSAQRFGSDFSVSSLLKCHENLPLIPLYRLDITQINLEDDSFDAISCLNVLEHIERDTTALKELGRILKPKGRLFITVPAAPHLYDFNDEVHFHVRRYGWTELRKKIQQAGLTLLDMNYFGVFPYPAFYVRKRLNQAMYGKDSFEKKHKRAEGQAKDSGRLHWMEWVCKFEERLGALVRFPFGIRLYATVTKTL